MKGAAPTAQHTLEPKSCRYDAGCFDDDHDYDGDDNDDIDDDDGDDEVYQYVVTPPART